MRAVNLDDIEASLHRTTRGSDPRLDKALDALLRELLQLWEAGVE